MIAANELRIGNILLASCKKNDIYNQKIIISGKHICDLENGKSEFDFYGIPITEEWLLKFGFTQSLAFKSVYFIGTFLSITLGNKIMFEINDQIISEIKYIHQLQNLYFALTQITDIKLIDYKK